MRKAIGASSGRIRSTRSSASSRVFDEADQVGQMDLPGFRLHPLKGDLAGFWAVTVRANWRIVFRFDGGGAHDVDLVDYD